DLAAYLVAQGFGTSQIWVMEALGGPREKCWNIVADEPDIQQIFDLVCVAVDVTGGLGLPRSCGLSDDLFDHDGQITKRPIRALTLSALAPRPGEVLWDIGSGSGSVAVEFLLAAMGSIAYAVEADAGRAARARGNAESFGVGHRYILTEDRAPDGLANLPPPNVVFIGGGASQALFEAVWQRLPNSGRLVVNAVTLETEALLTAWHGTKGGTMLRIELAEAQPLGTRRGWQPMRPVVQWSVVK
ncbi:MAG: precorrin-6Y C5,15-methyltransferase (decarboxylating) subunit CbiT, partial [Paracoccaceae bacterium]